MNFHRPNIRAAVEKASSDALTSVIQVFDNLQVAGSVGIHCFQQHVLRQPPRNLRGGFSLDRRAVVSHNAKFRVVDDSGFHLSADRVLNLEELKAYLHTIAKFLRVQELAGIERTLDQRDRESQESLDRPLGRMQREALKRKLREKRLKRSSLREPGRHIAIFTTASLPWMTGTAVNPLLRAAYLAKGGHRKVTLVIPWVARKDQEVIFPNNITFDNPSQQEQWVRKWVDKRTAFQCQFDIAFYPARYAKEKFSILPVGDPTQYIPDSEADVAVLEEPQQLKHLPPDVAVLEEPEHLTWYHHGRRWTDKFCHVVGIIHTNYLDYARREEGGDMKAAGMAVVNDLVCRMHCHKVIKLSDAVQSLHRQTTQFVHGVPQSFLDVGVRKGVPPPEGEPRFSRGAYFIGKAIWAKGYTELLSLMEEHKRSGAPRTLIDAYGGGEDLNELKRSANKRHLDITFHGAKDHLDPEIHEYRVFINPSMTDVVATTTAEALAMGKWVIVHDHPSNQFFSTFANCLTYRTPEEFSRQLEKAMAQEPAPMRGEDHKRLTWEDATERFLDVTEITAADRAKPLDAALDTLAYNSWNLLTGVEVLRAMGGAGINTRDNPANIIDYVPVQDSGGLFDSRGRQAARALRAKSGTKKWWHHL